MRNSSRRDAGGISIRVGIAVAVVAMLVGGGRWASASETASITIRGHRLPLHVSGPAGGVPVVVSSGDGGWMHLAPHTARVLAERGFFVVGFDTKAYLESFTSGSTTLQPDDVPRDYQSLAEYASHGSTLKPILVGVSEGAGLSVLAATDPRMRDRIGGVIGIGLPDRSELGWRWKDAVIYLTHGVPNEPTFSSAELLASVWPLPIALIHSSHDEFVPLDQARRLLAGAREPKRLWVIEASDHRFNSNIAELDGRLLDAVEWVRQNQPR